MIGNLPIPNWNEFMDDHEEQHAIFTGAGLGFAATASGEWGALGLAAATLSQVFERKGRPKAAEKQDLLNDIKRELHYFAAGLFVGGCAGLLARFIVDGRSLPLGGAL